MEIIEPQKKLNTHLRTKNYSCSEVCFNFSRDETSKYAWEESRKFRWKKSRCKEILLKNKLVELKMKNVKFLEV